LLLVSSRYSDNTFQTALRIANQEKLDIDNLTDKDEQDILYLMKIDKYYEDYDLLRNRQDRRYDLVIKYISDKFLGKEIYNNTYQLVNDVSDDYNLNIIKCYLCLLKCRKENRELFFWKVFNSVKINK
jgi:hypothetical protein